jgi:hypothetical protein
LVLAGTRAWADNDAEARMRRDVTFLASDECEGRGPETKGINKAADYIARQFKLAGLKPGGPGGNYFQPFTIRGTAKLEGGRLSLRGPLGQTLELKANQDFIVMGLSGSGKVSAPVVFVGYGATAPDIKYDDYHGVDVAGKVVVLLRRTPRFANEHAPFDGDRKDQHAGLETKLANAETHKAAAVLIVNDGSDLAKGDKLMPFDYTARGSGGAVPFLHLRRDLADAMLRSSVGTGLRDVELAIDRDLVPRSAALPGWTVTLEADVVRKEIPVKNIVGVLEGTGPLADQTIVVGAHYDHLGYGDAGSRAKGEARKQIHHGADDNGSGTTALMEIARHFGKIKDRQGRRLVFIAFSGEERGLLGSRHYCAKQPLFPLAKTAAMVNLDMVGRLRPDPKAKTGKDRLLVWGVGTAKTFEKLVADLNQKYGFQLAERKGGTGPSDHDSFYRQKVPVLFLWTGDHPDYHLPSDTADKINVAGMDRVVDLTEEIVGKLAAEEARPEYVRVADDFKPGPGRGMPRLGIMPDYSDAVGGVLIGGVSDGGPAAKAGLKEGDRIVEIAGKAVTTVESYMVLMSRQTRGQAVEVMVLRDGKKQMFKVVPQ